MEICNVYKGSGSKAMKIHIEWAMPNDEDIQEIIYQKDAYSLHWALKSLPVGTYERLMKIFHDEQEVQNG